MRPPPRAARGGLWPLRFRRFLNAAFCALFGSRVFALDHPTWAYWASFATPLDLVGLKFLAFLLKLGSTHTNLQSKLDKSKTKRN